MWIKKVLRLKKEIIKCEHIYYVGWGKNVEHNWHMYLLASFTLTFDEITNTE